MLYRIELGHYAVGISKNIYCAKREGQVDHRRVTKPVKKFWSAYKNLDDSAKWGRPKNEDPKTVQQARETNLYF